MNAILREAVLEKSYRATDVNGLGTAGLGIEQRTSDYLYALFDGAPDAMVVTDDDGCYLDTNQAACRMFGVARERLLGRAASEFLAPVGDIPQGYHALLSRNGSYGEYRLVCGNGATRYVECNVARHFVHGQHLSIIRDVTERRSLHRTVYEIAQGVAAETGVDFFRSLVTHLSTVLGMQAAFVAAVDMKSKTMQSLAVCRLGKQLENWLYPLSGTPFAEEWEQKMCVLHSGAMERFPTDTILRELGAEGFYGRFLFDDSGRPFGLLAVADAKPLDDLDLIETIMQIFSVRAASELQRKQVDEQLHHYAYHDSLTGLPNRMLFNDRLQQTLVQAKRSGEQVAVMFIDVDRLKMVNDVFGHACGDALLLAFSERLRRCVREGDTVARLSGDEFTVILHNIGTSGNATAVAEKIIQAMTQPLSIGGQELYVTASIGISLYPRDGEDGHTLLRRADSAMYRSKSHGGNGYRFSAGGGRKG